MKALIVDDNEDVRFLMGRLLQIDGFDVVEAAGGLEAMACIRGGGIDVIVLDVQMPDMDGWETLMMLRSGSETADVAVVMCTVKSRVEDRIRGFELGCDVFIGKPFDIDEFRGAVADVAGKTPEERRRARDAALAGARAIARAALL